MTAPGALAAPSADTLLRSGVGARSIASGRPSAAGIGVPAAETYPERAPFTRTELALILGFWTLIAVLSSANSLIQLQPRIHSPWLSGPSLSPLFLDFASAYLWALLTPPIFRLASLYPLERSGWRSRVVILVLGLAVAILMDVL